MITKQDMTHELEMRLGVEVIELVTGFGKKHSVKFNRDNRLKLIGSVSKAIKAMYKTHLMLNSMDVS